MDHSGERQRAGYTPARSGGLGCTQGTWVYPGTRVPEVPRYQGTSGTRRAITGSVSDGAAGACRTITGSFSDGAAVLLAAPSLVLAQ